MAKLVTAKELSKILGLSNSSINYYTNLGLFKITDRNGNKRLYNKGKIQFVCTKIRGLRKKGYPLKLIKKKLGN